MKRLLAVAFILMIFVIQIPLSAQTPNAAAYLNYGNQLYAAKDYTKAITYYKYATTLDPSNTAAFQGLGNCYYYLGQKPEALAAYQRAKTLNPSLTQLDPVIQYLQTQVNSNPANPSLPTSNFSAVGGATGGEKKTELDIMIGGALPLSGSDLLPSSLGTGMTLPSLAGGFGIGFGGGLGVYFPMGSNLSIGVNGAVYAYGANFNYSAPLYGENEGVTETINQTNIEIAAAVKYRLGEGGGNQTQPYLLGGLGFALISNSGSVTELDYI